MKDDPAFGDDVATDAELATETQEREILEALGGDPSEQYPAGDGGPLFNEDSEDIEGENEQLEELVEAFEEALGDDGEDDDDDTVA